MVGGPPLCNAIKEEGEGRGTGWWSPIAQRQLPTYILTLIRSKRAALTATGSSATTPPLRHHCIATDFDFATGLHCYHFTVIRVINTDHDFLLH